MKLREALEHIAQPGPEGAEKLRYLLACSSTPTNLRTFLHAYLRMLRPEFSVEIDSIQYGDLIGSLDRFRPEGYAGATLICEWYDLDPRLGFRRLGGWVPTSFDDILAGVRSNLARLQSSIEAISAIIPAVVILPTLPVPPLAITVPAQAVVFETELWQAVWKFGSWCGSRSGVRLLNPAELDRQSPSAERFNLRSELAHGSPYHLAHASTLAELVSHLLLPASPLKGLITDLDDTLWDGILGEAGVNGVTFTLENGAQIHGLYQQFLQSLAERGVLIAIASKNDIDLAEQALNRSDILVRRESFFPVEIDWKPKSESIARIFQVWNVNADAVVFVDDSPLEIAEVQTCFPTIRTQLFPKSDPAGLIEFFHTLRESFGRDTIRDEDRIRAKSVQSNADLRSASQIDGSQDAFLTGIRGRLSFHLSRDISDERAFELVNKTNQFNLNGHRISEVKWRELLGRREDFLLTVTYIDKFGPLGKIAVVLGHRLDGEVRVSTWVMSCRAFSRRIEHATMRYLFERLEVDRISFDFEVTARNSPLRLFFAEMKIPESSSILERKDFDTQCPLLPHALVEEIALNV